MNADGSPDVDAFTPAHGAPVSTSTVPSAGEQDSGFAEALRAAGEVNDGHIRAKPW